MTDKPMFDPSAFAGVGAKTEAVEKPLDNISGAFNPAAVLAAVEQEQQQIAERVETQTLELRDRPLGPVDRWSFSGLMNFELCPMMVKLSKVDGCPDPSGPAADRGSRLHQSIEDYIQWESDELDKEVKHFRDLIEELRNEYHEGHIFIEGEWAYDRTWQVVPYNSERAWSRGKLDALRFDESIESTGAWIIDWKSGRKFGNELKHGQQLQLYAIYTFLRYPKLEFIKAEMIYIDKGERMTQLYTRAQAMQFLDRWDQRGNEMTTTTHFKAKPSHNACRWCPHAKVQEGRTEPACDHRYEV